MTRCIVLQNNFQILGTTNWQRAVTLVCSEKAEVIHYSDVKLHPKMNYPLVIRLIKTIRNLWKKEVPWKRLNIHIRDEFTCQYCSTPVPKSQVTLDHIVPKSRGGKNSWENVVTSCFDCNNTKSNRTPSEAKMTLNRQPWKPTIMEFILMNVRQQGLEKVLKDLGIM